MIIERDMPYLTKVLEPGAAEGAFGQSGAFELSKAISLKRIADALELFVQIHDANALATLPPSKHTFGELRKWAETDVVHDAFAGPDDVPSNVNFTDLTEEKKP